MGRLDDLLPARRRQTGKNVPDQFDDHFRTQPRRPRKNVTSRLDDLHPARRRRTGEM